MKPKPPHLDQACPPVFKVDDPGRDLETSEDLFQAFFSSAENGFVEAALFLRNPWLSNESLDLWAGLQSNGWGWIERDDMSELPDFRSWAARVARQAAEERDDSEVLRLMSIAGYWERLADLEDWHRDSLAVLGPGVTSGLLGSCGAYWRRP
jgi:hypothetical protein